MSPTEALNALFAENELPMSDRNGVLYDALRDALAESAKAEPVAWRPIDTAPDDMSEPAVVRWTNSDGEECRRFDWKEEGCWMEWHDHAEHAEMVGGHGVSYTPPYEHWLPLPAHPPAALPESAELSDEQCDAAIREAGLWSLACVVPQNLARLRGLCRYALAAARGKG